MSDAILKNIENFLLLPLTNACPAEPPNSNSAPPIWPMPVPLERPQSEAGKCPKNRSLDSQSFFANTNFENHQTEIRVQNGMEIETDYANARQTAQCGSGERRAEKRNLKNPELAREQKRLGDDGGES